MFMKRLKHALTRPQNLYIDSDFKIVDAGLVAICIVFLQYLISVEKPDWFQTASLVLFSIAVPFLAVHLFINQTMDKIVLPIPAYVAKGFVAIFLIGSLCTAFGISTSLAHSSLIVSAVFGFCCGVAIWIVALIYREHIIAIKRDNKNRELEIEKLEIDHRNLELKREKLEAKLEKLELVQEILETELKKPELVRDTPTKP